MTVFVAADVLTPTNASLVAALMRRDAHAEWLPPSSLLARPRHDDVVLARFDALPAADRSHPGIWELPELERRGVLLLNGRSALLTTLDGVATALALDRAGLPHPVTAYVAPGATTVTALTAPQLEPPLVVTPRFGRPGRDAVRCDDAQQLARLLESAPLWLVRDGALLRAPLPRSGRRIRAVVVDGAVAWAAVGRQTATAVRYVPATLPADAADLALAAADAIGADFVGVDLLAHERRFAVLSLDAGVEVPASPGNAVFDDLASRVLTAADERLGSMRRGVPVVAGWNGIRAR